MQHTIPYTSQQNGVVKRKNHTLKEMDNCMIQSKGLSLKYWAKSINCENYIVNRTLIILVLYVDELIITGSDSKLLNQVKTNLKKKFEMTDLGFFHYFLGLQVFANQGRNFSFLV